MRAARSADGAVLVEFALVLVPLLLLIFGFLQFGIAMNAKIDITHLAAEGARYVAVDQNPGAPGSIQTYIRSKTATNKIKDARICVAYPVNAATSTSGQVGDPVEFKIDQLSYAPFVGTLPGGFRPPIAALSSSVTMRLEALPVGIAPGCTTS